MLDKFKQLLKRAGTFPGTWNEGWSARRVGNGRRGKKWKQANEIGKGRSMVITVHVSTSNYPFLTQVLLVKS